MEYSLFVNYEVHSHEGMDSIEPTPGESYSGFEHRVIELTVNSLHKKSHEPFAEEIKVSKSVFNLDEAYLVIVRYRTGSTFGCSEGEYSFIGIFPTRNKATELAKEIQQAHDDYRNNNGKFSFVPVTKNPAYTEIYCSWHGYFERLMDIEIHALPIDD